MAMKYNTKVLILTVNNKNCIDKLSLFLMVLVKANITIVIVKNYSEHFRNHIAHNAHKTTMP